MASTSGARLSWLLPLRDALGDALDLARLTPDHDAFGATGKKRPSAKDEQMDISGWLYMISGLIGLKFAALSAFPRGRRGNHRGEAPIASMTHLWRNAPFPHFSATIGNHIPDRF
jgi:hypothetical protein